MVHKSIVLAAALILSASAGLAAPAPTVVADAGTGASPAATSSSSAASNASAKPARSEKTKYCIDVEQLTGSRLNMQQCKTRAEWARDGVDVDELNKE